MSLINEFGNRPDSKNEMEMRHTAGEGAQRDAELDQALTDFRANVHAWSQAAYSRQRGVELTLRHRAWRLAVGWAMGCILVAGGVTGTFVEHQRQQEAARIAAAQRQARQKLAEAPERTQQQDPNLMAKVDSDISQEVPSAMEPLAQMMEGGESQ